jgi:acyl carrier protein
MGSASIRRHAVSDTFERFKKCAVDVLQVEDDKIVLEASFADDLDADSLDLVELVMALEEEFDINVDEDELENVTHVKDAVALVESKQ